MELRMHMEKAGSLDPNEIPANQMKYAPGYMNQFIGALTASNLNIRGSMPDYYTPTLRVNGRRNRLVLTLFQATYLPKY